jgi:hypothetical protein
MEGREKGGMKDQRKERKKERKRVSKEQGKTGKLPEEKLAARYGTVLRHVSLSYRLDFQQLVGCSMQSVGVRDLASHK